MKLRGIRVIDLSVFLPGPYLTLALADHGAEVIKIEPPEGDPGRHIGLSDGPSTVFFKNLNRGKKSVVLDLKQADARDALLTLCDSADVLVESFRPGAVARLDSARDYTASLDIAGRSLRVLAQPLLALTLACHCAQELDGSRLLRLYELTRVLRIDAAAGRLDWDALLDLMRRTHTAAYAWPVSISRCASDAARIGVANSSSATSSG